MWKRQQLPSWRGSLPMAVAEVQGGKQKHERALKFLAQNWYLVTFVYKPLANATYMAKLKAKNW